MSNPKNIWLGIISKINPIHNPGIVPLEPGYELDRLIAEKVLGWYQDSDIGGPRAWWFKEGNEGDIQENALHLNYFSTDIKAAWDLVERFELCIIPWAGQWMAIKYDEIRKDSERNIAPTAPHAICLAALFYASEAKQKPCYFCGKMAPVTFDAEQVFDDWSTKNEVICDWRSRFDGVRARLEWASLDESDKGCHPECALEYALREEGFV